MLRKYKFIAIGSIARVGKDTLCNLLIDEFNKIGLYARRFSFADALKEELSGLVDGLNLCVWTTNTEEKTLIRPLLVEYGKIRRKLSHGQYWWKQINPQIQLSIGRNEIPILTDCRYAEIKGTDELDFVKNNGGLLVDIDRLDENGVLFPPANKEEAENGPKLRANADFIITWNTVKDLNELRPYAKEIREKFLGA